MIRIGEKLNSSIPAVGKAMALRDAAYISALAGSQKDAGADFLDVNAALLLEGEADALAWAVREAQRETGARIMVDSVNPRAVEAALRADAAGFAVVNSVTADPARLDAVAPLLREFGASVVALAIGEKGIPPAPEGRLEAARRALEGLDRRGVPPERVFLDPLVEALSANHEAPSVTLKAIALIRKEYPGIRILCGVSNVSFGLPRRKLLNAAFLTAAVCAGADAAIFDVSDEGMRQAVAAAEALAGRDEYCMEFIRFCRENGPAS
jgi:5-methyltetrahydrofolate--homocysteine methyltransferase